MVNLKAVFLSVSVCQRISGFGAALRRRQGLQLGLPRAPDCQVACGFGAIAMNGNGLPLVDVQKCTACGDCVEAFPRDLIDLMPVSHHLIVQCRVPLAADEARRLCTAACDACGRCAADAAPGLIRLAQNLPVVDYAAGGPAAPAATFRCPTGAIRWVVGEQFAGEEAPAEARRAHG